MSSVNSMYGFNPYMNTGLNADFMSTATANPYVNPYADPYSQLVLQPQAGDTFQKSEVGSNNALKFAAVGGIGAGAGAYFFGDKLGTSFTKDGKTFSDDILKAYQGDHKEIAQTKALEMFKTSQVNRIKASGFASVDEFNAVKEYLSAKDPSKLPAEVTGKLPKDITSNIDIYKQRYADAITKIDKLNNEKSIKIINDRAIELTKGQNLACQQEKLSNLIKRKSLIEGLAKDAKPAQIEELITKNPAAFGIEKTAEAEIKAEAQKIAQRYGTKAGALAEVTPLVTGAENSVKNLRTTLNGQVAAHWDDAAKAFRADAPEALTKAAKSFKWAKAGKFAAIAAGAGLVLGWMFGGNKS